MDPRLEKLAEHFAMPVKFTGKKGSITGVKKFTNKDAVKIGWLDFDFEVKRSGDKLTIHLTDNTNS